MTHETPMPRERIEQQPSLFVRTRPTSGLLATPFGKQHRLTITEQTAVEALVDRLKHAPGLPDGAVWVWFDERPAVPVIKPDEHWLHRRIFAYLTVEVRHG